MSKNQSGIATILGILLIALMIGGLAVGIEAVRNPTSFSSRASGVFGQVNIFSTKEIPTPIPVVRSTPKPTPTPLLDESFMLTITKGPYIQAPGTHCFDLEASSSACTRVAVSYSFDQEEYAGQTLGQNQTCAYSSTICTTRPKGEHSLKIKPVGESGIEGDTTTLNYEVK